MKAIKFCEYGPPDVLKVEEVEKPVPKDNELLVRVRAAHLTSLTPAWCAARRSFGCCPVCGSQSSPALGATSQVWSRPSVRMSLSSNRATKSSGKDGARSRSTYACALDRVALKPANITFEQAGAVGLAGLTALQGLRTGKIHAGQKVLINGASGGVGTFALQIAKAFDTEVTAVCSTRNVEMARTLGADHVIDYTKEDFTKREERYDLLFDNVNNHSFSERRRLLKPGGICVLAGIGSAGLHEGTVGADRWELHGCMAIPLCRPEIREVYHHVEPGGPEVPQ